MATTAGGHFLTCTHRPSASVIATTTATDEVPALLRCSVFMDYGQIYRPASVGPQIDEWGAGLAFLLTAGQHFDARLTLAWALNDITVQAASSANKVSANTTAGSLEAYFTVGTQF